MITHYNLDIDVNQNRTLERINVKQFENGSRIIRIFLYDNGEQVELGTSPINSTIDTDGVNHIAYLNASVDGTVTEYERQCSISNDVIEVPVNSNLTTLSGFEHCEVKILGKNSRVLYTATFYLNVEPSVATTDSAAVLKTTELASTLSSLDARVTTNEEDIAELQSSGGGGGGSSTEVLEKLGESEYTTEEYIDLAKTTVTTAITSSETRIKSDAADKKQEILSRISTAEDDIEDFIDATETVILNKLGTSSSTTEEFITAAKTSVNSSVDTAKTALSSQMSSSLASVEGYVSSAKTTLLNELTAMKIENEEQHLNILEEIKAAKKEIMRVFSGLADELATGDGSIGCRAVQITSGAESESFGGTATHLY